MTFSEKWLLIARSRLFVAVVIPALIGAAVAGREGTFTITPFILVIIGIVCAECSSMMAYDYRIYKNKTTDEIVLPGNPVVPARLVHPRFSGFLSVMTLALSCILFCNFLLSNSGSQLFILALIAALAGYFYAFPPFRYAYFSTSIIPPAIALGTALVLGSTMIKTAFFAALPLTFSAAATITSYRFPISTNTNSARINLIMIFFSASYTTLFLLIIMGRLPPLAVSAFLSSAFVSIGLQRDVLKKGSSITLTSMGVAAHVALGLLIAGAILFSKYSN